MIAVYRMGHINLKTAFVETKIARQISPRLGIVRVSIGGQQKPAIRARRISTAEGFGRVRG
jgi:hypothetical protein